LRRCKGIITPSDSNAMSPGGDEALPKQLATALEAWFRRDHRDMPWRRTRDPYAIWVSEIMLQQTRVETVERYYDAFLARFPTVAALAAADEQAVLQAWSGLGYYRRARFLHRGAQHVAEQHGGRLPMDVDGLRSIPGVGEYTAGAIASIAFDLPVPLVDGNVARVLSRIERVEDPREQAATARRHWQRVAAILRNGTPRVLSQALMELGATVCTPRSPTCGACPWRSSCQALAHGTVEQRPVKSPKKARKAMRVASVVVVDAANPMRVWLEKRAERGLFGGLWAPPSRTIAAAGTDDVRAGWRALLAERGVDVPRTLPVPIVVERTLTHRDLTFYVARVTATSTTVNANGAWFDDVSTVGTSTAVRAVLAAVSPLPLFG
jgi:A/G-specific adenine glycosylase